MQFRRALLKCDAMLLALKLKLAAKTCLVAGSVATAVAQTVPQYAYDREIPETVAIAASQISYRLAGDFQENGRPTDGPREIKRTAGFRIMKYQLRTVQYDRCVAARACRPRPRSQDANPWVPAVNLSYEDATAYAAWLSARTGDLWRLPTDVEWIAAAGSRVKDEGLNLPREADISERWLAKYEAESRDEAQARPKPIGSFGVNEQGVADLAGNIWEWTSNCFTRYTVHAGESRPVTTNCGVRVVEGAHRTYMTNFIRDARAGGCAVGRPPDYLGVRLVREARPLRRALRSLIPGGLRPS